MMERRCYVLLRRRYDVPIRRRGDTPLRRLGHVPSRPRWVFHLRRTCDVAGRYRETSLRCRHDVLMPGRVGFIIHLRLLRSSLYFFILGRRISFGSLNLSFILSQSKTSFSILVFREALTIYLFTAVDISANAIVPFSRIFISVCLFQCHIHGNFSKGFSSSVNTETYIC